MITYSLLSKTGKRTNNEDNVGMFQKENCFCFALADGLGGHGKGELASQIAVQKTVEVFAQSEGVDRKGLCLAFEAGQQEILARQQQDRSASDMKTTEVILQIGETQVQWGHIGDSRLYYFKDGKLEGRTLDHSVPQMLVAAGKLKEKQIRNHADRNRLLRVMGIVWEQPKYQIEEVVAREGGQAFLMCTDGFWELIEEKKIMACLKRAGTPEEWLNMMEETVLKNGRKKDMDNYSAIGVWIGREA